MAPSKPAPIAIVGGGPCGLTFARLLERAGIDYTVFERDQSPETTARFQGGTLDLTVEGGQAALKLAGLSSNFEKLARRDATTILMQDSQGQNRISAGEGNDRPEIDRLQLRRLLLDSIPAHRVRWGKGLGSIERGLSSGGNGPASAADWILRFNDGSSESGFRLIVGSDGAWSKVRQLVSLICSRFMLVNLMDPVLTSWYRSHLRSPSTRARCSSRAGYHRTIRNTALRSGWSVPGTQLPWVPV